MKNVNIIKKNHKFQQIIGSKQCFKTLQYFIYYTASSDGTFHYGISVGKKLGNAVMRNRIKRQMRSIVWQVLPELHDLALNVIIIARAAFTKYSYNDNLASFRKIMMDNKER